jgi:hypothetical protein
MDVFFTKKSGHRGHFRLSKQMPGPDQKNTTNQRLDGRKHSAWRRGEGGFVKKADKMQTIIKKPPVKVA